MSALDQFNRFKNWCYRKFDAPKIRRAKTENLGEIDRLARKEFGDDASSLQEIRRLYNLDNYIFWVVYTNSKRNLRGYLALIPLTEGGEKAIKYQCFNGENPAEEHMAIGEKKPAAIYIGAIYGDSFRAKGTAVAGLQSRLEGRHFYNVKKIYARAATQDGLRLLTGRGFQPVIPTSAEVGAFFYADR